ncbi:hypothetical protein VSQ33_24340, partial [Escherichia coli]|uniref:hypothetical protein n=1 Tax=Escherichia coli TaxID=562 RepID=UPI002DBE57BB
ADRNRSHWSTSKTPSYTKSVSWHHHRAGVGASWQKHYGTDVVTQLGYGQRISWNDVIDAGATLRWEKRPYDGDREHNLYVEFDMTFRF